MQPIEWRHATLENHCTDASQLKAAARRRARARSRWAAPSLAQLKARSAEGALSVRAICLASFQVLLHRYRAEDDVAVAARANGGTWRMTHASFAEDRAFVHVVRQAAASIPPGADEVSSDSANPPAGAELELVTAALRYEVDDAASATPPPASAPAPPDSADGAELTLVLQEQSDALTITFDYDSGRYTEALIEELGESYQTLLASVAEDLHQPVSRLNLLSPAQRQRILHDWNRTQVEFDPTRHVEQLFDAHAAASPDAVALRFQGTTTTYDALRRRSNRIAHLLQSRGIGPGQLVAVCVERSEGLVAALLGILKAGAAYVPLDPAYPTDRLEYMFADAHCAALITQASAWRPQELSATAIDLDADQSLIAAHPDTDVSSPAGPDDLAYVIYTSGSTGRPKGVAVRRSALVNCLHALRDPLKLSRRDAWLALTTISFDIAATELYLPLINGARIVLATREDAAQPERLARLVDSEGVTVLQATPATWRMLLGVQWPGWSKLRVLCGGEAMTRDLAEALLAKAPCVWNLYGPTETTIWSTMCRMSPDETAVSIGRPIDNTEVYILDRYGQPLPAGGVGELHIGGAGLARGYLNRPELTAEKFIPHPFGAAPGARVYRTGDLARWWPDGRIECLGRVDHQVKIRGFRIELGEVEARLSAHPEVKFAAVVARSDGPQEDYLAAYWVPQAEDAAPDAAHLRAFLAEVLPRHMIPAVFVRMNAFPLTPSGKIDRRTLPAPDREAFEPTGTYLAPRDDTERTLVELFEQVLGVKPVGIRDDFFALGGHSLSAARLVTRVDAALGKRMALATLAAAPTIEQLAPVLTGHAASGSGVIVPFRRTGGEPPLLLVAGVGGHVLIFRDLAGLLGPDQPVYGIQGIGLDGQEAPLNRMEDIAARYLAEVDALALAGPVTVAGWSMGGVLAFEMARQLHAAGRPPHAVVIIDAYAPWVISPLERVRLHLQAFARRSPRGKLTYLAQRFSNRMNRMRRSFGIETVSAGLDGEMAERVRRSTLAQFEALANYRPQPLNADIDVDLLRAEQTEGVTDPRSSDVYLGWRSLVQGSIRVTDIPGCHTGIFQQENVGALAAAISACTAPRSAAS